MFEQFLTEMGLSEKESLIYMALLQSDFMSVADIAKKTKINRTTVYPVIEYLIDKKLVREVEVKGKTKFQAESPERLESYIHQKKDQLREMEGKLSDMIPQFKSIMHKDGNRPIVELHEGKKSILNAAKNNLKNDYENEEMYSIYPRSLIEKTFSKKELSGLRKERVSKNIRTRSIITYDDNSYTPGKGAALFQVDQKKFPVLTEINIHNDIINIYTFGESKNAIYIKNKDTAQTLRTLFKLAFKYLENK